MNYTGFCLLFIKYKKVYSEKKKLKKFNVAISYHLKIATDIPLEKSKVKAHSQYNHNTFTIYNIPT